MIKLLNNFNKKDWLIVIFCFVLICLQVWLELKMPDYMSEITVLVQTEGSKMKDIIINGSYIDTGLVSQLPVIFIQGSQTYYMGYMGNKQVLCFFVSKHLSALKDTFKEL